MLIILFVRWIAKEDDWIAIYYPDASNLFVDERSMTLDSLEECRAWINNIRNNRRSYGNDDYECGKNCKAEPGADVMICEETVL